MGEIGSGSGSSFPGALDTDASIEVNSPAAGKTKANANVPNDLASCIVAIETELGVDPAGSKATVVARLDQEHQADGSHKDSLVCVLSGIQTHTGTKTYSKQIVAQSGVITNIWGVQGTVVGGSVAISGRILVSQSGALITNAGVDSSGHGIYLRTKVIEIGDWNMDTTTNVSIAHGLTLANIRHLSVIIRDDDNATYYDLPTYNASGTSDEAVFANSINIRIFRSTAGTFDGSLFDSTSYNRGWIIIDYI